jgi:hypothetical protein
MPILTKKRLSEIIDGNDDLIGVDDTPTNGSNLDTQANNTTDYNAKIGTQPFRYDMGRFGFTMMPFMEGKENQGQLELLKDLSELMHDRFDEILEYYYRNPNKLKPDFRKSEEHNYHNEEYEKNDTEWAKRIIKIVEKHFEKAFKEPETLDEAKIVEDKVVNKKNEDEISKKSDDKEVREKKLEKIAGLINKLEKKDIDKLINLLERKSNG